VDRALASIECTVGRIRRNNRTRLQRVHCFARHGINTRMVIAPTHRTAALVVMVMTTEHEIDAIAAEQGRPPSRLLLSEPLPVFDDVSPS
jgi:hypothetical protein